MSAPSVIERVKTTLVALKMPRALEILDVTLRGNEWVGSFKKGRSAARDLVSAATLPEAMHAALLRLEADEAPKPARSGPGGAKRRNAKRWNGRRKRAAAAASTAQAM